MAFETVLNFSAGYATYDEATKIVTPRPGPGRIVVSKDPQEPYYSFVWEPRDGFEPPEPVSAREPLLMIPGDAQWVHCKSKTNGRVFSLKFQTSDKREFFWLQARTDAKDKNPATLSAEDERILKTFEKILTEEDEEEDEEEEEDEDEPMEQATTETKKAGDSSSNPDTTASGSQWDSIAKIVAQNIRSRAGITPGASSSSDSFPILSISNAFSTSDFSNYINSLSEPELEELYAYLPDGIEKNKEELLRVVWSTQFSQGVESLSTVLRQGGLGPVVANELGFPYTGEGVVGYLNGVYKSEESKKKKDAKIEGESGSESKTKDQDGDDVLE